GAKVIVYDTDGKSYENTTDINGVAKIDVPANGSYLIVIKDEYYILTTVTVAGDTTITVNASAMHYANITSTPINVDAKVKLSTFNYTITITTNVTVYASASLNITYPEEVSKFPFKYVLENITYDGVETNETTITLDMARDYSVNANYSRTFYMTLECWMVAAIVVVIVVALLVAWKAGSKTAKAMIQQWKSVNRKFVKKKG
ncbi:MAG: hypothetical protein DRN90_00330, partial [Thermoproteota archaeon]